MEAITGDAAGNGKLQHCRYVHPQHYAAALDVRLCDGVDAIGSKRLCKIRRGKGGILCPVVRGYVLPYARRDRR